MQKYVRSDDRGKFRKQMNDAENTQPPPIRPDKPVEKASCAQLIKQLSSTRDKDKAFPLIDELGGLIANKETGWETAVDTLIEWMGHESLSSKRKHYGFFCLKSVLRDEETLPEVHSTVVEKLRNAENDGSHPFRELDAGKLLADASRGPSEIISVIEEGSKGSRQQSINTLNLRVVKLAEGSPSQAVSVIESAAPVLLDILSEEDDGRDSVGLGFDKAAVLTAFSDWSEKLPDETLEAVIVSGSREEETDWVPDERKGPYAMGVIINYISKEQPDIAEKLAKKILINGKFSHLTVECLRELEDSAIKPVIDEGMRAEDDKMIYAAGFTLAILGPKALDALFDYMDEKGDEKTLMRGFGMLSGSVLLVHDGSSQSAIRTHLAGLEKKLRGSSKLKKLIQKAEGSGDEPLITQSQEIQTAIGLM